jgi:hypothetical protein
MADLALLDRSFDVIMRRLVDTGQAPHYAELARALGCSVEAGRQAQRDLLATGIPAWVLPGTDYLASFAPFNVVPTQYRVAVNGEPKWYAQ